MIPIFFNEKHNGDIHVSRTFVKKISEYLGLQPVYHHNNNPSLISECKYAAVSSKLSKKESFVDGNTIYFNTWYNTYKDIFNEYSCSYSCLYKTFERHLQSINVNIKDICDFQGFLPSIDFSKYKINIPNDGRKMIFFSNSKPLSGQLKKHIDQVQIIRTLAKKHSDKIFFVTNEHGARLGLNNIIYTNDLIGTNTNNLNENAYISTFCDYIVGASSGPFTFSLNKSNFFSNKKFICFTTYNSIANWGTHKNEINMDCEFFKVDPSTNESIIFGVDELL